MKSSTIYDIAQKLQVTPSTVSRALSDHPRISEKTKRAVKRMAEQLNYRPNGIAAAFRKGQTQIIGVIMPKVNRAFFAELIKGIESTASSNDYHVIVTQSYDSQEKEQLNIDALLKLQVDGIIVSIASEATNGEHLSTLVDKGIPLVLCDRIADINGVNSVVLDDYLGAFLATEHLIEQGFERIAHLTGNPDLNIYRHRRRGYEAALAKHHIPINEDWIVAGNMQYDDGVEAIQSLMKLRRPPNAIFSSSDYAAMGALQWAKNQGMKIPEDLGFVGFANEPFAGFSDPSLSSVDQLSSQMGEEASKLLINQIQNNLSDNPKKIVLPPKLIVRDSSIRRKQ